MIIELVTRSSSANDPRAKNYVVRCYNDDRVFAETDDLFYAVAVARLEATSFDRDALVRVRLGSTPGNEWTLLATTDALAAVTLLLIVLDGLVRFCQRATRGFRQVEISYEPRSSCRLLLDDR